jgi:hypothetical protein
VAKASVKPSKSTDHQASWACGVIDQFGREGDLLTGLEAETVTGAIILFDEGAERLNAEASFQPVAAYLLRFGPRGEQHTRRCIERSTETARLKRN